MIIIIFLAVPIGVMAFSFALVVLPFLCLLSEKVSISSAMLQEFGTAPFSLKISSWLARSHKLWKKNAKNVMP